MIVGNGMLANAFKLAKHSLNNTVIFASGVSNSNEQENEEFEREKKLLENILLINKEKLFVYFSTCSIYDSTMTNSQYVYHKMYMERIVRENSNNYLIIRLPQVIGKTAAPTIINFLFNKIKNEEEFTIFNRTKRNFIDVDDVVKVVSYLINKKLLFNEIINLASTNYTSVYEVVVMLERVSKKRAIYNIKNSGGEYYIDVSNMINIYRELSIDFDDNYVMKTLNKYYSQ